MFDYHYIMIVKLKIFIDFLLRIKDIGDCGRTIKRLILLDFWIKFIINSRIYWVSEIIIYRLTYDK